MYHTGDSKKNTFAKLTLRPKGMLGHKIMKNMDVIFYEIWHSFSVVTQ